MAVPIGEHGRGRGPALSVPPLLLADGAFGSFSEQLAGRDV
jgi:hypothetical protein